MATAHKLDRLSEDWSDTVERREEIIKTILKEKAEGLFGVGVKLAALPKDGRCADPLQTTTTRSYPR
jgi:hypothetical protein